MNFGSQKFIYFAHTDQSVIIYMFSPGTTGTCTVPLPLITSSRDSLYKTPPARSSGPLFFRRPLASSQRPNVQERTSRKSLFVPV